MNIEIMVLIEAKDLNRVKDLTDEPGNTTLADVMEVDDFKFMTEGDTFTEDTKKLNRNDKARLFLKEKNEAIEELVGHELNDLKNMVIEMLNSAPVFVSDLDLESEKLVKLIKEAVKVKNKYDIFSPESYPPDTAKTVELALKIVEKIEGDKNVSVLQKDPINPVMFLIYGVAFSIQKRLRNT